MKKILLLTPTLPFPPHSGGVIKSNKLVEFLSNNYDLSVACLLKNDDTKHVDEFKQKYKLHDFISLELNIERNAKNLILSNLQGIPLNLYRNKSAIFKEMIDKVANDYDVIFCDHYVMFQYIPKDYKGKIILHEHNCEYLIWKRYADIEKSIPKKLALLNQAYRIKKYEQEICKKSTVILAAPNDIDELVKIGADKNKFYETYHLGDDSLLEQEELHWQIKTCSLLYIGTLSWEANVDGLIWFYNEVLPFIIEKYPPIKVNIIGKNPDTRLKEIAAKDSKIILRGFVEDLEPYFRSGIVFIAPLRFGSGIKVKVINSLYAGIPCVTTSIGAEGLKVVDGEHMFIKDNPKEFADAVNLLLRSKETWVKISSNARKIAHKYYTWNYVLENIRKAIEN
jgi:glycosyltransferase involved in cell wall biosynthesis